MNVHQRDIGDIDSALPPLIEFGSAQGVGGLLIVGAGFEERSRYFLEAFSERGSEDNLSVITIVYPTNRPDNRRTLRRFRELGARVRSYREIVYRRSTFGREFGGALTEYLSSAQGRPRVLLDMSATSSYIAFPVVANVLRANVDLRILYCEAAEYFPMLEEWRGVEGRAKGEVGTPLFPEAFEQAEFQSKGVGSVSPFGMMDEANPGNRPSRLVAVPNFSPARMNAIVNRDKEINKTKFEDIVWVIGEPPAAANRWRTEAIKRTNGLEAVPDQSLVYASTLDYRSILLQLEEIWLECRHSHFLSIGSLGSKMQHVGVSLFLFVHPEVGLWLSEPAQFRADRFSAGVGGQWMIEFGPTEGLRELLAGYMRFEWQL